MTWRTRKLVDFLRWNRAPHKYLDGMPNLWTTCSKCNVLFGSAQEHGPVSSLCPRCQNAPSAPEAVRAIEAWHYALGKRKLGPFSLDEMKAMAADGRLQPEDMVLPPGAARWVVADTLPDSFSFDRVLASEATAVHPSPSRRPGLNWFTSVPSLARKWFGRPPLTGRGVKVVAGALACVAAIAIVWYASRVSRNLAWLAALGLFTLAAYVIGYFLKRGEQKHRAAAAAFRGKLTEARNLLVAGRLAEAEQLAQETGRECTAYPSALAGHDAYLDRDAAHLLGLLCQIKGSFQEAEEALTRSYELVRMFVQMLESHPSASEPTNDRETAVAGQEVSAGLLRRHERLMDLAALRCDMDQPSQALELLRQASEYRKGQPGDYYPDILMALTQLAEDRLNAGQQAEAEAYLRRAMKIRDGLFGADPVGLETIAPPLAQILIQQDHADEAAKLLARAGAPTPAPTVLPG